MKRSIFRNLSLFSCFVIFGLLLLKDPFSERTLIPNFEPVPDTFYYVTSARNFLEGNGLQMMREGRVIRQGVPPLYSLTLLPVFSLKNDPRMFYFTNVFLAFVSLILFYLILGKITGNSWIRWFVTFLYITNYFLYWYPTLAMAENLILPLFLAATFLLISEFSIASLILAPIVGISFYATKYASAPLTASFLLLYLVKILYSKKGKVQKIQLLVFFVILLGIVLFLFSIYEYSIKQASLMTSLWHFLVTALTGQVKVVSSNVPGQTHVQAPWFAIFYIPKNFSEYFQAITGSSMRFLWDYTPLVPKFVGLLAFGGFVWGLFTKGYKFISSSLLLMLFSAVLFMSTFYTTDARYIYHAIPTMLLGFGIFLQLFFEYLKEKKIRNLFYLVTAVIFIIYLFSSAIRIKSQIMLNLRYSETPWYYVAVLKMDEYFTADKVVSGKKPVVISALPPYYIDFFSNGNYTLLPLSYEQEFRGDKEAVWGPNDYSDLPKLYTEYLKNGYPVYVSRSGLGNEQYTNRDYQTIGNRFKLTKVVDGCYSQCDIHKLDLKE